ncbi:MAG: hypothetical protein SF187_07400 [Deltaproteobacteria bacterium]|nr:hypothetical protein [Deltaproteobacteria bacterium]
MRARTLVFFWPLLLALACENEGDRRRPAVDASGADEGGVRLDGSNPFVGGDAQGAAADVAPGAGGAAVGSSGGSGGAGGRDPNLLGVRIVHASTKYINDALDFCVQMGNGEPIGPYLEQAGVIGGVPFGSVSAVRYVPRGANLVMRAVRASGTDCTGPLGYPSLTGLGTYDEVDVVLLLSDAVISKGLQAFPAATASKDTLAFYDLLNDVGAAPNRTASFVPSAGPAVPFVYGMPITALDAAQSGRVVVTSPVLSQPIERTYKPASNGRTLIMLLGATNDAAGWKLVVCDYDAPAVGGVLNCSETVRR